jgi:outer membrane protein assembly factor BamB
LEQGGLLYTPGGTEQLIASEGFGTNIALHDTAALHAACALQSPPSAGLSFNMKPPFPLPFLLFGLVLPLVSSAADQAQWGQAWSRNPISAETPLSRGFDPETKHNVKWVVELGTQSHSTPVVAGGRIFLGTNNANPRDPKHIGDRGVFMGLDEKDGHLLWQLVVPKLEDDDYLDWPETGIASEGTVEGDHVYTVTNRGEVVCLDVHGMANGNDGPYQEEGKHLALRGQPAVAPGPLDADIIWLLDMKEACGIWCHDGAHSSILIHGDHLYLNTGTGVDNTHRIIRRPLAPGLIVVDKKTGRYLARENENISPDVFHAGWSSPSFAEVDGKPTVFYCGGNGITYAFDPLPPTPSDDLRHLTKRWTYDMDPDAPKDHVHRFTQNRKEGPSNIYGMPVIKDGKLFIAGGGDVFWGKDQSWLKCIDARTGKEIWSYPMGKHTLTTPAIHGGLVYATDSDGVLHCVDEATGQPVWTHPMNGSFWSSPMIADGKIFLGTRKGNFTILTAGREKQVLCNLELKAPISATVTAANGTFYLATMKQLWAIKPD